MLLYYRGAAITDYGAASVRFDCQGVRNRAQQVYKRRYRAVAPRLGLACYGVADANARKLAVETLLAQDGGDLALVTAAGAPTARSVFDVNTLNGVRVVDGPNWSDRPGAHGVTYWDYSATWEWEMAVPPAGGGPALLDWQETVILTVGVPKVVEFNPVNTPGPVLQVTTGATASRAVVTGQAVGAYERPVVPAGLPDLDPTVLWESPPEVTVGSALRTGYSYTDFPVRWTYRYVSVNPLLLLPREWLG